MIAEYDDLDALDLAALIRGGDATAEEVLETAIDRVERRNPAVNAVIQPLYDHARAAIAAGLPDGPFTGVPYLLKALTAALEGQPTTRASKYFESWIAPHDSEHVRRLKAAGFVIFGRTNTCELGLSLTCEPAYYGATRNPWNPQRISGGSSGGAAWFASSVKTRSISSGRVRRPVEWRELEALIYPGTSESRFR